MSSKTDPFTFRTPTPKYLTCFFMLTQSDQSSAHDMTNHVQTSLVYTVYRHTVCSLHRLWRPRMFSFLLSTAGRSLLTFNFFSDSLSLTRRENRLPRALHLTSELASFRGFTFVIQSIFVEDRIR